MNKPKPTIAQLSKALADTQQKLRDAQEQITHQDRVAANVAIRLQELRAGLDLSQNVCAELRRKNALLMEVRPLISNLIANNESVVLAMRKINEACASPDGCNAGSMTSR